jgi:hypothetical protein
MKRNTELESKFKSYFEELEIYDWQSAKELLSKLQDLDD